jgi:hypothetical protein
MKDLVWELFLMVRELMPASEAATRRQQEWAARFHELEVVAERVQVVDTADHDDDDDNEPAADPHEHGVPARPRTRKKR